MNAIERVIAEWRLCPRCKRYAAEAERVGMNSVAATHFECADELERLNREVIEPMERALTQVVQCAITDADTCSFCHKELDKHSDGCPIDTALDALAKLEGEDANATREA